VPFKGGHGDGVVVAHPPGMDARNVTGRVRGATPRVTASAFRQYRTILCEHAAAPDQLIPVAE
jgi:hypothetical protein